MKKKEREEIVEIDEDGVVHSTGKTSDSLKKTKIRDKTGEF